MLRYIDDMFAVVLFGGDDCFTPEDWKDFKKDMNSYGMLKWEIDQPSKSVNYLDLTVTIVDVRIETKTYPKPLNPHKCRKTKTEQSSHQPCLITH